MSKYIEKLGKELVTEILDIVMIGKKPNKDKIKDLMIKQGIITKATSDIQFSVNKLNESRSYVSFNVYNMANQHKLYFEMDKSHLPDLIKELATA